MKKFLFILFGVFVFSGAFATGENVPTSKSYVDAAVATKQDKIPANDGVTQVLTNTGTAGEYGTKGIYDANGEYATQQNNLVDAVTMNAGVQNAINSEFQCIEWADPNDHTSDCLLLDIRGTTERRSPNLFDASKITNTSRIVNNGDGSFTITTPSVDSAADTGKKLSAVVPELEVGKTYTFSINSSGCPNAQMFLYNGPGSVYSMWNGRRMTITQAMLDTELYFSVGVSRTCNVFDIQITEGTTAMPYVPYGNLYLPNGE